MRTHVFIPARFEASRFPGKMLAPIAGASVFTTNGPRSTNKSLIRRTWEVARRAGFEPTVLTDSPLIFDEVNNFGGRVSFRSSNAKNGTERCAIEAACAGLDDGDLVINLQGDSPLMPPEWITFLDERMNANPLVHVGTVGAARSRLMELGEVCIELRWDNFALDFTRYTVSHVGTGWIQHFGLYAYRVGALKGYHRRPVAAKEAAAGLEQLRFLEHGQPIGVFFPQAGEPPVAEVNFAHDVDRVSLELARCLIV